MCSSSSCCFDKYLQFQDNLRIVFCLILLEIVGWYCFFGYASNLYLFSSCRFLSRSSSYASYNSSNDFWGRSRGARISTWKAIKGYTYCISSLMLNIDKLNREIVIIPCRIFRWSDELSKSLLWKSRMRNKNEQI